jgi:hypothetical protein
MIRKVVEKKLRLGSKSLAQKLPILAGVAQTLYKPKPVSHAFKLSTRDSARKFLDNLCDNKTQLYSVFFVPNICLLNFYFNFSDFNFPLGSK